MTKRFKQFTPDTSFDLDLKRRLKDPRFRQLYEKEGTKLEIAYRINQLRRKKSLTQRALAQKMKTTQSVIARMEQGEQNFTISTLHRLAHIFGKELEVNFR